MAVLTKKRVLLLLLAILAGRVAKRRQAAPTPTPPRPVSVRPATDIADLVPPVVSEPVVEPIAEVEPEPEVEPEVAVEPEPEVEPEVAVVPELEVVELPELVVVETYEPVVEETPEVAGTAVPEGRFGPGSAAPLEGGASPGAEFTVKGNAGSMLFHTPDSPYYGRTRAEQWFSSEEAATAAGFRRWNYKALAAAAEPDDEVT